MYAKWYKPKRLIWNIHMSANGQSVKCICTESFSETRFRCWSGVFLFGRCKAQLLSVISKNFYNIFGQIEKWKCHCFQKDAKFLLFIWPILLRELQAAAALPDSGISVSFKYKISTLHTREPSNESMGTIVPSVWPDLQWSPQSTSLSADTLQLGH